MRVFRHIAVAAMVTLGAFSVATYTSCSKSEAANAKFVGTYSSTETCSPPDSSGTWSSTITASSTGDNAIVISNYGNSGASVTANVSGQNVTIPTTTVAGATTSGNGVLSGNTLTISYSVSAGGSTFTCVMTMVKQ
jgi:hypothetical protein